MFEISTIEVLNQKENSIFKKSINLDKNLDCFIMISSSNKNLAENLLNNAVENIIDKITKEETYNNFGIALENINYFLKNWRTDQQEEDDIDMSISILNENNFMFSNIGKSTVYLINKNSEIIELTERNDNKKIFLFISNGTLANSEMIISSTLNILKYLSKSDIMDGMILANDIEMFNKNIKNILQSEIVEKNCIISSLRYKNEFYEEEEYGKLNKIKDLGIKILDTKLSKKIIGNYFYLKEKISNQNKTVKNGIFFGFIILLTILLFFVVSGIFDSTRNISENENSKSQIEKLENFIHEANRNVGNPGIFDRNIKQAEEIITEMESKKTQLFKLDEYKNEINLLKKQFNKIEIFNSGQENLIFSEISDSSKKVLKNQGKTYIITKKGVIGPIVGNTKPKTYIFNSLGENEEFEKAVALGQDLYLMTNTSKIVRFNKNGAFNFANVIGQQTWQKMKDIISYSSSLYILGEDNQIYKHSILTNGFKKGEPYLKEEDRKNIGEIIGLGIDGGIYLARNNLSLVKFFKSPSYRLESLTISKYPKNYNLEENVDFEIKTDTKLHYLYMLLNNKIFVFKPNSISFLNTKDLTYVGQIEGGNEKIIDFHIDKDSEKNGEIVILNNKGLYKLRFEISDDKIIIR